MDSEVKRPYPYDKGDKSIDLEWVFAEAMFPLSEGPVQQDALDEVLAEIKAECGDDKALYTEKLLEHIEKNAPGWGKDLAS